jgi:hypothetical protein
VFLGVIGGLILVTSYPDTRALPYFGGALLVLIP